MKKNENYASNDGDLSKTMNVLVFYYAFTYPTRDAIKKHFYCLREYTNHNVVYVNMFWQKAPKYIKRTDWDAVIFHNTYLICRPSPELFQSIQDPLSFVKQIDCVKIAIAQDEANNGDALCRFITDFGVNIVYSLLPTIEARRTMYEGYIPSHVRVRPSLAGYVDLDLARQFDDARRRIIDRDIDIGYRSFKARARNGRLGVKKWEISDLINKYGPLRGLKCDCSVEPKDVLNGQDWIDFLSRSRYQIGVEGGSTVLDRNGEIKRKCDEFEAKNPSATYDEIEENCFPGMGFSLDGGVISPRVFECAMAQTCQILVEGRYNGILQPDIHYIPLKPDYSNIDDILSSLDDEERRERICKRAFDDLIGSGKYSYQQFVADVFTQIGEKDGSRTPVSGSTLIRARFDDWWNWRLLRASTRLRSNPTVFKFVKTAYAGLTKSERFWVSDELPSAVPPATASSAEVRRDLLFGVGCAPDAAYRIGIEASALSKRYSVTLFGAWWDAEKSKFLEIRGYRVVHVNITHNSSTIVLAGLAAFIDSVRNHGFVRASLRVIPFVSVPFFVVAFASTRAASEIWHSAIVLSAIWMNRRAQGVVRLVHYRFRQFFGNHEQARQAREERAIKLAIERERERKREVIANANKKATRIARKNAWRRRLFLMRRGFYVSISKFLFARPNLRRVIVSIITSELKNKLAERLSRPANFIDSPDFSDIPAFDTPSGMGGKGVVEEQHQSVALQPKQSNARVSEVISVSKAKAVPSEVDALAVEAEPLSTLESLSFESAAAGRSTPPGLARIDHTAAGF